MGQEKAKVYGQVFTPDWLVSEILQVSGVLPVILNAKVLEPSFGDGAFLFPLVKHAIETAISAGYSKSEIATLLDEKIHGVELDFDLFLNTKNQLVTMCSIQYGLNVSFPNLVNQDFLSYTKSGFSHIIGNPPYVRIHNVPLSYRETFKDFKFSSGTSDLYILFFERALSLKSNAGSITFITPNGFLRGTSQRSFRQYLVSNKLVRTVLDFGSRKVFPNASTYVCITTLGHSEAINFVDKTSESSVSETKVLYSSCGSYLGESLTPAGFVPDLPEAVRLAEISKPRNGTATLADSIFLVPPTLLGTLEPASYKTAVKASTFKGDLSQCRKIIFPYKRVDSRYVGLSEAEMSSQYTNTYSWLCSNKSQLLSRASDKSALWFHYGRSQAIQQVADKKLVLSPFISPVSRSVNSFLIPGDTVVHSGLFFTGDDEMLLGIKDILDSEEFYNFARMVGKDLSSGFKSVSSRMVSSFIING